ncbi:hypothetical protein ACFRSX_35595 [Streptomyces goshikiensis]|uniref:hypothetical protein n=1 Tax=Streptomyces TaxID=1883 RepID=UPI000C27AF1C|nr:hypothetical protein [Streptomyces sp. CB02120-2]PJN17425.1 hypothetical protein CG724_17595 [Streptomyces sp. CB02120-2]
MTEPSATPSDVEITYESDDTRVVAQTFTRPNGQTLTVSHCHPDALRHHYTPGELGEDLRLYSGGFVNGHGKYYTGNVGFTWHPSPRVQVTGTRELTDDDYNDLFPDDATRTGIWSDIHEVLVEQPDSLVPQQPQDVSVAAAPETNYESIADRVAGQIGNSKADLDSLTFLIPNGWEAYDASYICNAHNPVQRWSGRTTTAGDGWTITFDRLQPMDSQAWRQLRDSAGIRFTHVGQLVRTDGSTFTSEQALNVLERIRIGLALALGRRTSCFLPVGYRNDKPVWALWQGYPVDPFTRVSSHWLDTLVASRQLASILAKVLDFTAQEDRRDALTHALAYYIPTNTGFDAALGVALPISGLQLLSFFHFVTEGPVSATCWERQNDHTEDEVRKLLTTMNVSTPVPTHFTNLATVQARLPTQRDALGTIIYMRNHIIHPVKGRPGKYTHKEWAESSILANYWLGLALLHLIGYNDDIAAVLQARVLHEGDERREVPWALTNLGTPWATAT